MGLIWNLVSLAKNARQTVDSVQAVQGRATGCIRALNQFQNNLVQKDYELAIAGNPQAQFAMGERFFQGMGVAKDEAQAAAWYLQAAMQGHWRAQSNLAMMFFLGRGVEADPAEAYKWICLAARSGDEDTLNTKCKIAARISAEAAAEGEQRAG